MTLTTKALLGASLALSLAAPAVAQSNDVAYCNALAINYRRYVHDEWGSDRPEKNIAEKTYAISRCDSDPAASIPVLEKALRDAKVNLPARG